MLEPVLQKSTTYSMLIVVPTLNSYTLLSKLVSSLQEQTWDRWRVVFVDGPSSPAHREWLSDFCNADSRFQWINQSKSDPGIFGAMNQGFSLAGPAEWILFWGSDDWAAQPHVFEEVTAAMESSSRLPDLLVCRGRYVNATTGSLSRVTRFYPAGLLSSAVYRHNLWLGSTPPHQATLIGPRARCFLNHYESSFHLTADLDYFLQLSRQPGLIVQSIDLELVHMSDAGVSGRQPRRRLAEVRRAYLRAFSWQWWIPFSFRYFRRFISLLTSG